MAFITLPFPRIPRPAFYGLIPLMASVAIGIACLLGSYWLFLEPSRVRVNTLQATYDDARHVHEKQVASKQTQELVQRGRRDLEKLWETLPSQRQFPALAVAISELGKRGRISIPGMTYSTQPSQSGLAVEGSLRFRAIGEYADIYRFLHQIETAQSYLVIESLDVTRSNRHTATGKSLIELNVRVITFLRPDPSTQRES
jgi:Tfp pilus assembly protein PilO